VWVPYVQTRLDEYTSYYNAHTLRKQKDKHAPTGISPDLMTLEPELYDLNASDQSIEVQREWVEAEREYLGGMETRDALFETHVVRAKQALPSYVRSGKGQTGFDWWLCPQPWLSNLGPLGRSVPEGALWIPSSGFRFSS
jgi:hypothetical protein